MSGELTYDYAIIRIVPRVERGEQVNVGVILFAREQDYLDTRIEVDVARLCALAPDLDSAVVERHLRTFADICAGDPRGGPVAALPQSERFHWLVAPRSTIIQTSTVHTGRCNELDAVLDHLLDVMVRPIAAPRLP